MRLVKSGHVVEDRYVRVLDDAPIDVLHLHDWHTGPAAIYRDVRYADDPIVGDAANPDASGSRGG